MRTTLEHLHKELRSVRDDLALLRHILVEEGELTDSAKKSLEDARRAPREDYLHLDEV